MCGESTPLRPAAARSSTNTRMPAAAMVCADAAPIPLNPPVTTTTPGDRFLAVLAARRILSRSCGLALGLDHREAHQYLANGSARPTIHERLEPIECRGGNVLLVTDTADQL